MMQEMGHSAFAIFFQHMQQKKPISSGQKVNKSFLLRQEFISSILESVFINSLPQQHSTLKQFLSQRISEMNLGSCVTLIRAYAKVPRRHKLVSLEQYSWNCKQLPAFQCGSRQSIPFDVYPNHAYKCKCLAHILPPSAYSNCQALHISLLPATGFSYCVCHKACINTSISIQHWPCSFWLHFHSIIFLTSTVILLFHMWAAAQTCESSTFTATFFGCKPVS